MIGPGESRPGADRAAEKLEAIASISARSNPPRLQAEPGSGQSVGRPSDALTPRQNYLERRAALSADRFSVSSDSFAPSSAPDRRWRQRCAGEPAPRLRPMQSGHVITCLDQETELGWRSRTLATANAAALRDAESTPGGAQDAFPIDEIH